MCCIGGFVFKNFEDLENKKDAIINLLVGMEERGKDATGISFINTITNKVSVLKYAEKSSLFVFNEKFLNFVDENLKESNVVLLHTRQATQGDKNENKNNHPILYKEFNSVLIHNGIISNYKNLKDKYKLSLEGDCDSEIILNLYHKFNGDLNKLYYELNGGFAFALYDNQKLTLLRFSNPLNISYLKELDCLVFCSTLDIIKNSFCEDRFWEGGFFRERVYKYTILNKEIKNNSYLNITFNGLDYDFKTDDLNIWRFENQKKKKNKKNKQKNLEIITKNKNDYLNKQKSYIDYLLEEGEEYAGEFDDFEEEEDIKFLQKDTFDKYGYEDRGGLYCECCGLPYKYCECGNIKPYGIWN